MFISDETIQNIKKDLESRGHEVIELKADDNYVLAKCKTRFGQTITMKLPTKMFN